MFSDALNHFKKEPLMYTDMVSDYNFILGDLNYRFKSTYTDFIDKI